MEEVKIIARTFRDMGIWARPHKVCGTPAFYLIGLEKRRDEKIDRVLAARDELSHRLTNARGVTTHVRLQRLPLWCEVPRLDPSVKRYQPFELDPHCALLGTKYTLRGPVPVTLNFATNPHALIAAQTNGGKSVLMRAALLTLVDNMTPDDLRVVLIDMKNRALSPFATLPHVNTMATNNSDALTALRFAYDELQRRKDHPGIYPRLTIWIDELAQLDADTREPISTILALGRELNINVISATQHPTASILGGAETVINYTARIVGHVAHASAASTASGRPGTGAELLPAGNGSFLLVEGSDLIRFQSHYIDDATLHSEIRSIQSRYGAAGTPYKPATGLEHIFEQYWDGNGSLKRGGMIAAIRALYGDDASTGGRKRMEQNDHVLELLHEWKNLSADLSATIPEPFPERSNPAFQQRSTTGRNQIWGI